MRHHKADARTIVSHLTRSIPSMTSPKTTCLPEKGAVECVEAVCGVRVAK
jgi:hypothetical protein